MKIQQLKATNKKFEDFKIGEWRLINPEHYGKELDYEYWHTKHLHLEATENNNITGALTGEYMAGVLCIPELIVAHNHRGKGIGKALLEKAEKWVIDHGGHEVYLVTGIKWQAMDFYKKLNYELVTNMPRHYSKTDFVLFRKFLA